MAFAEQDHGLHLCGRDSVGERGRIKSFGDSPDCGRRVEIEVELPPRQDRSMRKTHRRSLSKLFLKRYFRFRLEFC